MNWLHELYEPGRVIGTFDLLGKLNTHIFQSLKYAHREEPGVQLPNETLRLGSGSCRDFAVLMMEAARYWGLGARFVTGYIQLAEGQHGATHAWTEIYLPRRRMARLRSDKQQACRQRTYFGCRRARTGKGFSTFRFLGRPRGCFRRAHVRCRWGLHRHEPANLRSDRDPAVLPNCPGQTPRSSALAQCDTLEPTPDTSQAPLDLRWVRLAMKSTTMVALKPRAGCAGLPCVHLVYKLPFSANCH